MYCMNCGVRLGEGETRCPLCGLRAYHPDIPRQVGEPLYPRQWVAPEPERTSMRFLFTIIALAAAAVCLLVDLSLWSRVTWSGYVLGALAVAYVLLALPLWFRRPNPVVLLPVDFVAVGLYLLYINLKTSGGWFLSFAFPVTGIACLLTTTVVALAHYLRRGYFFIFGGASIAVGCSAMLVELFQCITFGGRCSAGACTRWGCCPAWGFSGFWPVSSGPWATPSANEYLSRNFSLTILKNPEFAQWM